MLQNIASTEPIHASHGTTKAIPNKIPTIRDQQLPVMLTSAKGAQHNTAIYVVDGHLTELLLGDTDAKALSILSINKGGHPTTGSTTEPQTEQVTGITANLCAAHISLHIKDNTITPA